MHASYRQRFALSLAIACGALAVPGPEARQGQQPSAPVFRSRVDVIEIELRAVDSHGAAIVDLDRADVEVLENGRRQEITAFARVSTPHAAAAPSSPLPDWFAPPDVVSNRADSASRIFVLVLDDLHVDRRNTMHVKQAARRFVEQYVQPGDLVSVVYTSVRPDAAQDFTSDRRLLVAAIDKFIGRKLAPATVERMAQYNTFYRARGRPQFEDLRDPQDGERAFNARSALGSIEALSGVLARVTGRRKAALVFSEGLDYDLSGLRTRGRLPSTSSGATSLPSTLPTGASEADALGRPDVHSYAHDVLLSLQSAIGAASRANVALYTMDVQGGNTGDAVADLGAALDDPSLGLTASNVHQEMRDAQEALVVLAENTGGFAALTPSNYEGAFSRIVRESSEYYLLAYSPSNPAPDGTYRDITVKVNRPGVRVSARRGYYAPRQPIKRGFRFEAPGISDATSALVMAPVPASGLALDVQTIALRRDKKKTDVIVTTYVNGRDLGGPAPQVEVMNALELAVIAIDSGGKVHAANGRVIQIQLDRDASHIMRHAGYRIVSRLQVPPGRYQIRQAVRERNGGRQGSVFADIEVPGFTERLSMGGLLLTSARAAIVPTSVEPETYERLTVLPSVRRAFSAQDELTVATEIYQRSRPRDIELTATVTDSAGRERYRQRTPVAAGEFRSGASLFKLRIPLTDVDGDLMLTLEGRPAGSATERVTRRIAFTVTPR
jgi:VWFA-related protein